MKYAVRKKLINFYRIFSHPFFPRRNLGIVEKGTDEVLDVFGGAFVSGM
jgi:hypothetical protein